MPYGPPPGVDTSVPHSARMWDYWLGGRENYPADRAAGDAVLRVLPGIAASARADRAFLGRAVRFLVGRGIGQFLDLGAGLPTVDNTHEVAQRVAPSARIVYVDNDPLVLAHARTLLRGRPEGACDYIEADIRDIGTVLEGASRTLDLGRPVGLMMLGVLNHVLDDDEAGALVASLLERAAPGSHLVLSHTCDATTAELDGAAMRRAVAEVMERGGTPIRARSPERIAGFFTGTRLVEPGVVSCSRWRPDPPGRRDPEVPHFAGVGAVPS
ncbi:translation initiation factor IF-2 [Actinomadura sp. CNU-125]|uniref:SAM-dependent methyltransferase n=1 Tax=Actinomadura sp. CNU-125 TaxID=1904961 RepID=UPI0009590F4C|nr:SAM-dependent methyltransferase [Actinomadura sp. CNU-125]OLT38324.1 translation initiation factor IF-2 [Actinomadura sp. CNU-125]